MFDIEEPLVPGIGAAGVRLGSRLNDLPWISSFELLDNRSPQVRLFSMADGALMIHVERTSGEVVEISVRNGYRGSLPDGVMFGVPLAELSKSGWQLDERLGAMTNPSFPGTRIYGEEDDPSPAELSQSTVSEVVVAVQRMDLV